MAEESRTLTLEAVRHIVETERGGQGGSMPWTLRFLEQADRQSGGRWTRRQLTGDDASRIVLPPHQGEPCHGDRLRLVPPGGATVAEAAEALLGIQEEYARANAECWSRMSQAATAPLSTIVVTTRPLDLEEFRSLVPRAGRLYHLDGFHRLVGWMRAGRLGPRTSISAIVAEIAGP